MGILSSNEKTQEEKRIEDLMRKPINGAEFIYNIHLNKFRYFNSD
jgi:hypothetical protein